MRAAQAEADELRSLVSERDDKLREAQEAYDELEDDRKDVDSRIKLQGNHGGT